MSKIKSIIAREIKDSRGNPTIEVELETERGSFVASVPSGASTGKNEALELRDADGKGVQNAISNVNDIIAPKLKGKDPENQKEIDDLMIVLDGTENKSKLGANAILAVSIAVCRAGAGVKKIPLYRHVADLAGLGTSLVIPKAMFNILEGGVHTNRETGLRVQETMIVPQKKTMAENLIVCNKVFNNLKKNLKESFNPPSGGEPELGFEGGFEAPFSKVEQALYAVKNAIGGEDTKIALDCAASQYFSAQGGPASGWNGRYHIDGRELNRAELLEFYEDLAGRFPVISIEDPFSEDDWQGFESIVRQMKDRVFIIGDDLTTTNIKKIKEAHNKNACNGVILKLNQIGTVSETIEAANLAKSFGWKTIISHRSGETMDDFIADFAVGLSTDFIKSGSPAKEERMVKYSRLLEIEQEI